MQVECQVRFIRFRNPDNGCTVFETKMEGHTEFVRCTAPDIRVGQILSVEGEFDERSHFGRTFVATRVEEVVRTVESLRNIFQSGMIKGIGPGLAERILRRFGKDTIGIMDNSMDRLTEVSGISASSLVRISRSWKEYREAGTTLVRLQDMGLTADLALAMFRKYGASTDRIIRDNPYCLTDVWGVRFELADSLAAGFGIQPDDPRRIAGGVKRVLQDALEEGHVFLPFGDLKARVVEMLSVPVEKVRPVLVEQILKLGTLANDGQDIYLPAYLKAEKELAASLHALVQQPMTIDWNPDDMDGKLGITLDDTQVQAIRNMVDNPVSVLTGGPGTGKTTIIKGMISVLEANDLRVALAAPTGRAAKRMAELTGRNAKTIHRLLRYKPAGGFSVNSRNPLRYDAVIVDESSMMDLILARNLLSAVIPGTRLVFVGDTDQLPSVGAGNVLQDIIDSNLFPVTRLDRIHRQATQSMIVSNAYNVNHGIMPERDRGDFWFIPAVDSEMPEKVLELVRDRLPRFTGLSHDGIQVLCATRRMKDDLNDLLQESLNDGERIDRRLRVGDKVMQVCNDYDKGVFNGDMGHITSFDTDTGETAVEFDGESVTYTRPDLAEIEPAYAVTVHKSQGSEYPAVVVCLSPSDRGMLQRNLLYTAMTRARKLLVVVGSWDAVRTCVENDRKTKRNSRLIERLEKEFGNGRSEKDN